MLIGITGQKRSGKNTFADYVCDWDDEVQQLSFAAPLKEMIRTLFREAGYLDDDEIEEYVNGDRKEEPLELFQGRSTRYAMQTLGTEWRNFFGPNMWLDIIERQVEAEPKAALTDVRFLHEATLVKRHGGKVVRVKRFGQKASTDMHASEQEMESIEADITIHNYGSLLDFETVATIAHISLSDPASASIERAATMLEE